MPTTHRPTAAGVEVLLPLAVVAAACSGVSGARSGEGGRSEASVDGSAGTGRVPESDVDDGLVASPSSGGEATAADVGGAPPGSTAGAGGSGADGSGGDGRGGAPSGGGRGGDGGAPGSSTTADGSTTGGGSTTADASASGSTAEASTADAGAQGSTADASSAQGSTAEATSVASATSGDASSSADASTGGGGAPGSMSFFVTSVGHGSGDFGGLPGVDAFCQALAVAAGAGDRTWRAFVSTSAVDARDRIGTGPWYDATGALVASDVPALLSGGLLHERALDENGAAVPNAVTAPGNNEHDILTGSTPGGTFSGESCADWTSSTSEDRATVGHCDASFTEGGGLSPVSPSDHWSSTHSTQGCDAASLDATGSTGRVYCFAL